MRSLFFLLAGFLFFNTFRQGCENSIATYGLTDRASGKTMSLRHEIREILLSTARDAGAYLLSQRDVALAPDEKTRNDFVTHVDRASEKLIIDRIQKHFPEHNILAEEGGGAEHNNPYQWIIDPLDGTRNFIQRIPFYCVSIGVYFEGSPLAGAVYNPEQDELFFAWKGEGATLNNQPIRCSTTPYDKALLATGFPHLRKDILSNYMVSFGEIFKSTAGVRRLGAAALDLCYVAAGRMDGYWEIGLHPWDIAAGMLIAEEAGVAVTDFHNRKLSIQNGQVVAAPETVHSHLSNILSKHFLRDNHE